MARPTATFWPSGSYTASVPPTAPVIPSMLTALPALPEKVIAMILPGVELGMVTDVGRPLTPVLAVTKLPMTWNRTVPVAPALGVMYSVYVPVALRVVGEIHDAGSPRSVERLEPLAIWTPFGSTRVTVELNAPLLPLT